MPLEPGPVECNEMLDTRPAGAEIEHLEDGRLRARAMVAGKVGRIGEKKCASDLL